MKAPIRLFILLLALCAGGCLSFEKQTLVLFFPSDGKEIQGLFIYEGLLVQRGADKNQAKDLLDAMEDLEELVRGDAIILGDRLGRFPLKLRPKETVNAQAERTLNLFKPFLGARKGQFLLGDDGKLSYCQPVTLREPQKLVGLVNKMIAEEVLRVNDGPVAPGMDAETDERFRKFARDGQAWLRFDKGRLSVSVPGTPAFFSQVRSNVFGALNLSNVLQNLDELEKAGADVKLIAGQLREEAERAQGLLKTLGRVPWSVDQRRNLLTVALGYGDNESFQIPSPLRRRAQFPNLDKDLQTHAKTLGVPIRTDVTVEDMATEFQRTGQFPRMRKE